MALAEAPKQLSEKERQAHLQRLQKEAGAISEPFTQEKAQGDRIISVSRPLVEEALAVLTPIQPGAPGEIIQDARTLPTMDQNRATAILKATAYIDEPLRTTVLTSEQGTIVTFVPQDSPKDSQ